MIPFWLRHPKLSWQTWRKITAIKEAYMESKSPWQSKTLWANVLMLIAWGVEKWAGTNLLDPETQAAIVILINFVLRLITKKPVSLKGNA